MAEIIERADRNTKRKCPALWGYWDCVSKDSDSGGLHMVLRRLEDKQKSSTGHRNYKHTCVVSAPPSPIINSSFRRKMETEETERCSRGYAPRKSAYMRSQDRPRCVDAVQRCDSHARVIMVTYYSLHRPDFFTATYHHLRQHTASSHSKPVDSHREISTLVVLSAVQTHTQERLPQPNILPGLCTPVV